MDRKETSLISAIEKVYLPHIIRSYAEWLANGKPELTYAELVGPRGRGNRTDFERSYWKPISVDDFASGVTYRRRRKYIEILTGQYPVKPGNCFTHSFVALTPITVKRGNGFDIGDIFKLKMNGPELNFARGNVFKPPFVDIDWTPIAQYVGICSE